MKFSAAAVLALASGAVANLHSNVTYTTEVVTAYETYCPGPTVITYSDKTYTITSVWKTLRGFPGRLGWIRRGTRSSVCQPRPLGDLLKLVKN
jgi:hypothetical protein